MNYSFRLSGTTVRNLWKERQEELFTSLDQYKQSSTCKVNVEFFM